FIYDSGIFTGTYSATLTAGMNAAFDAGQAVIVQDSTGTVYYDAKGQLGGDVTVVAQLDQTITAANIDLRAGSSAPSSGARVFTGTAGADVLAGGAPTDYFTSADDYFNFAAVNTLQTGDAI